MNNIEEKALKILNILNDNKHESYIVADIDDISICINTGDTYGISRLESRKVTVID